eukprot:7842405-Pyramimonas_sp.AAC.1
MTNSTRSTRGLVKPKSQRALFKTINDTENLLSHTQAGSEPKSSRGCTKLTRLLRETRIKQSSVPQGTCIACSRSSLTQSTPSRIVYERLLERVPSAEFPTVNNTLSNTRAEDTSPAKVVSINSKIWIIPGPCEHPEKLAL